MDNDINKSQCNDVSLIDLSTTDFVPSEPAYVQVLGNDGDVKFTSAKGTTVTLPFKTGDVTLCRVEKVFKIGTTATTLVAWF